LVLHPNDIFKIEKSNPPEKHKVMLYNKGDCKGKAVEVGAIFDSGAGVCVIGKNLLNKSKFVFTKAPVKLKGVVAGVNAGCSDVVFTFVKHKDKIVLIPFVVNDCDNLCLISKGYSERLGMGVKYVPNVDLKKFNVCQVVKSDVVIDENVKIIDKENYQSAYKIIDASIQKNDSVSGLCSMPGCAIKMIWKEGVEVNKIVNPPIKIKDSHQVAYEEFVEDLIKKRYVVKMNQWESGSRLYFLAVEQINKVRFCADARAINERTVIKEATFAPAYDILLHMAEKSFDYISQIDIVNAFFTLPLETEQDSCLWIMHKNVKYKFTRVPFGIRNAPEEFNRVMREMLSDMADFSTSFFDNIFVFTKGDHITHANAVKKVINRLNLYNMPLGRWNLMQSMMRILKLRN
jgi:hypothetical protein